MSLGTKSTQMTTPGSFPGCGTFIWNPAQDDIVCSDELKTLLKAETAPRTMPELTEYLLPADRPSFASVLDAVVKGGRAPERELRIAGRSDEVGYVNIRLALQQGDDRDERIVHGLVVDVTRSRSRQSGHSDPSVHAANGLYTYDIATGRSWWSLGMYNLLDIDPRPSVDPFGDMISRLHPEDRDQLMEIGERASRRLGTHEITYRLIRPDGSLRWVIDRGETVGPIDPETKLAREIRGTLTDITTQVESKKSAEQAARAFDDFVDAAPFGLYITDSDLTVLRISDGARPAFSSAEPIIGRNLSEVLHAIWPDDFATDAIARFRETLRTGEQYQSKGMAELRTDVEALESYHWVVQRIPLPDGRLGLACHFYDLSDHVNREMILELQQKHAETVAQELRLILDNSLAFVGVLTPGGTLIEANAPALIAGGLERRDVIGRKFWETYWWTHDAETPVTLKSAIETALTGDAVRYDAQVRMRGGAMMTIDFMLSPIRDESGKVLRLVASGFDVTERKTAEEHVRLLMGEVNHRSKNVLTLVQSVARLTYRSNPETFMETFQNRLRGLARSYDLLLSEQTDAVNVEHLVRAQLAHFEGLIDARIAIEGPEMTIKGEVAQALGMAVHELATNAGKYGALSNESGRVDIRWGPIDPKGGKKRFEFKWIERDGPPVTPPTQTGFGSTVLGPMVQSAINGDVDLRYDPSGLIWHAIGTDTAISR